VYKFKQHFSNPFRISQWKHQLRNRKQKPGETIEEYIAGMEELWKRVDPEGRRIELDRIHEFIEGLRPEFVVPVQSAMPRNTAEAMEKARALETAFSLGMDLSAYSMLPDYLPNMNGGMIPAKTNMAMYRSAYATAYQLQESMEKIIERKITEGIMAALSQMAGPAANQNSDSGNNNSGNNSNNSYNNNNNQPRNRGNCYSCGKAGHMARDCRSKNQQNNNNNNRNNNSNNNNNRRDLRNVECYNCNRKGHVSKDCRAPPAGNNRTNNNGSQPRSSLN
jgi:hypothetical protein